MNKYSTILIDSNFSLKNNILKVLNNKENICVISAVSSENATVNILKSFIPTVILCNDEIISKAFIQMIQGFFSIEQNIAFIIYGTQINSEYLNLVKNSLKIKYCDFIELSENLEKFYINLNSKLNSLAPLNPMIFKPAAKQTLNLAKKIVAIGASAGGPRIIKSILQKLPNVINAAVLIVQHIPLAFSKAFATSLQEQVLMPVSEIEQDMPIYENNIYVAKGGIHFEVSKYNSGGKCELKQYRAAHNATPSVDALLLSLPKVYKDQIIGVILTGMGEDGAVGMQALKMIGAKTIIQDEKTSMINGMPSAVRKKIQVDYVLPYTEISYTICRLINLL